MQPLTEKQAQRVWSRVMSAQTAPAAAMENPAPAAQAQSETLTPEKLLSLIDGVLLLVDAAEGPMPQTRFVLQKALELGHKVIVVVNKIDRPDALVHEVMDEVLELLLDLNATEEQFDSPTIFCSAREGTSSYGPDEKGTDLVPLFETIVNYIDPPTGDENGPLQVLVSSIDYNEFVGRMGIGRIERGTVHQNQEVIVCDYHDPSIKKKETGKHETDFDTEAGAARRAQLLFLRGGGRACAAGVPGV